MSRPIRVGHIDLSFHDASALEVEKVLEKYGHAVVRTAAPHEEMFRKLGNNEVDVLVSAWLPSSHGKYLKPLGEQVREVTVLYEPFCIWGVPEYVPESINAIEDLKGKLALSKIEKLIQGINPGAGISRFSQSMMMEYGLARVGYHFQTGTEEDCFGRFEAAHHEQRWVVIPLWHPQALHHRYKIRPLKEPKSLLGGVDSATLIVRSDAETSIGAEALDELSRLHLGNARVSELDDDLRSQKKLKSN